MCSEFWDGWFDHWGAHHHITSVEQSAAELDELLASGASVNLYMFHGGSNFGFTSGANDKGTYLPIVTSYDYDAPLDELGEPGPKYWAFRDVIAKYAAIPAGTPTPTPEPRAFSVPLERGPALLAVLDSLGTWTASDSLPTMDELGQYRGYALYRTRVASAGQLRFEHVRDRATLFLNGLPIGTLSRDHHERAIQLPCAGELDILVEDQGRVSYGRRIGEPKGLIGPAHLDGELLERWSVLSLDLSADIPWGAGDERTVGPRFSRATVDARPGEPLVLCTRGWGKGVAFFNGFNLGRYWSRGPQETLVVPAPLVLERNTLRVFDEGGMVDPCARFVPRLELGFTEE
jgi:beta-galactosidase